MDKRLVVIRIKGKDPNGSLTSNHEVPFVCWKSESWPAWQLVRHIGFVFEVKDIDGAKTRIWTMLNRNP